MTSRFCSSQLVISLLMFLALVDVSTTATSDLQNASNNVVKVDINLVCGLTKSPRSLMSENVLNHINHDLLPKATGAQRSHLQYCRKRYTNAYIEYIELNKKTTIIAAVGTDCEDSFRSSPSTLSPLTQTNTDFFNLVDILAVASYLLSHP
ncbi:hypothetical protein MKW94_020175 [Papaver nudicaule]|uniref:Pectinesterase inhibitor domain-containing protein n=1 Tax=Papaver nudicaule TaxID=74823 RepID=A0AA42B2E3_PAPNU|nr:hypothetical protein [Papaver nudicaule]